MTIKDMSLRAMRSMAILRGSLRRLSGRSASPRCRSSPPSSRPCAGRGAHAGIVYVCVSELQRLARFATGQRFPHSATLSIAVRPRRGVKPRARKQNYLSNLLLHVVAWHSSAAERKQKSPTKHGREKTAHTVMRRRSAQARAQTGAHLARTPKPCCCSSVGEP